MAGRTSFKVPAGQPISPSPELQKRIKALGPDASLEAVFQEMHAWAQEQIAQNRRNERTAKSGRLTI